MRFPLALATAPILLLISAAASAHGVDDSSLGDDLRAVDVQYAEIQEALLSRRQTPSVRRRMRCATRARALLAAAADVRTAAQQAGLASRVARITRAKFRNDRGLSAAMRQLNFGFETLIHDALDELATVEAKSTLQSLHLRIGRLHRRADRSSRVATKLLWNARALSVAGVLAFGDDRDAVFVISAIGLSELGIDLDGDGIRDNSLSRLLAAADELGVDLDVDMLFEELVSVSPVVTLLQLWSVQLFTDDPFIEIGVTLGLDTDGDTGDNASGTEEFVVSPLLLGDDGFPLARSVGSLDLGAFEAAVDSADIDLGGVELPFTTLIRLEGRLTTDGAEGQIGIAVPLELLATLLEAAADEGVADLPPLAPILALAADVDTDGDGANDALALVLDFEAAPAVITTEF